MQKKSIIWIVAAVIIIGAAIVWSQNSSQNTAKRVSNDQEANNEQMQPVTLPGAGTFVLNSNDSTLNWSASRIIGTPHVGTVGISDGQIVFENNEIISGNFTIDMTTITEADNNERFLGHVKNDDFFGVEQFPTSILEITSVEPAGSNYMVTGNLTIREITNEISFPAVVEFSEDTLLATANFEIDRTRWNIVFDSGSIFTDLGERAIKDEIEYSLDLMFERQ